MRLFCLDASRPCAGSLLPSPNRHLDAGTRDLSLSVSDERAVLADGYSSRNGSGHVQPIRSYPEKHQKNKDPASVIGSGATRHQNTSNSHPLLLLLVSAFIKLCFAFRF